MTLPKRNAVIESITLLNVVLFLYTGIAKLMDYSIFKEQIAESQILKTLAEPIALLLPWIEFIIVILLIVPRWRLKGFYSSLLLMAIFTGYIITLFSISNEMPCSCGGLIELLSWKQHIVFNSSFIFLNILGIVLLKKQNKEIERIWDVNQEYRVLKTDNQ